MTEAELMSNVVELAHLHHYLAAHFGAGMRQSGNWVTPVRFEAKGFPDLVLVKPGRVIYVELKSVRGKLTPEQCMWRDALKAAGQEWHMWSPDAWKSGLIEEVLDA